MSSKRDYYEIIGLSKSANESDIKSARDLTDAGLPQLINVGEDHL